MSYNLPNQIIDASGNYINIDNSGVYIYNSGIGTADYTRIHLGYDHTYNYHVLEAQAGGSATQRSMTVRSERLENTPGFSYIRVSAGSAGNINSWRNFVPQTDDASTLGSASKRWSEIHGAQIAVETDTSTDVVATFKGAVSQSANLTEWKNSADDVVASIDASGDMNIHNLVADNFTVSGTFTYLNNENVTILDKQLELASDSGVAISGDAEVDQGGIVIKSTDGDKKWLWDNSTNSWTSNVGISCTGDIDIDAGNITLDTNQFIEWVGSNNRVRGISGGVGAGRIELIAGSYNVMQVRGPSAGATGGVMVGAERETDYKFEVVGSGAMNGIYASGESTFVPNAADQIPVYVSGAASQTANLLEVVEVDGTNALTVDNTGVVTIGPNSLELDSNGGAVSTIFGNRSTYVGATSTDVMQIIAGSFIQFNRGGVTPLRLTNAGATFAGGGTPFSPGASVHARAGLATNHAAIFQGQTAQTADITEWQDISSTILASVGPEGTFSVASGEIHVYNSGYAIGATDYERLEIKWDNTSARVVAANGGTGADRNLFLESEGNGSSVRIQQNGGAKQIWGGTQSTFYVNLAPAVNNNYTLGNSNFRMENIYTADLDVSGILYASGDPGTAGQVLTSTADGIEWQDVAALSGPSGEPSGVAFYGNDGLLTVDDNQNFVWDSGSNRLFIGASGLRQTGNNLGTLTVHADADISDRILDLRSSSDALVLGFKNGNSNTTPVAQINYQGGYISPYNGVAIRRTSAGTNFILRLLDTSNILKFEAESDGRVQLGGPTLGGLDGTLTVYNVNSTTEGVVVHGATSQTANMTTWVDSNDEPLAEIDKDGFLHIHNSGVEFDETNYEKAVIGWDNYVGQNESFLSIHNTKGGTGTAERGIVIGGPRGGYSTPQCTEKSVVIGGGAYNSALNSTGSVLIGAQYANLRGTMNVICGGLSNTTNATSSNSFIGGGTNGAINAGINRGAVIGGEYLSVRASNTALMAGAYNETRSRSIGGGPSVATRSAVIGGAFNNNCAPASVIIGGNYARSRIYGEVVQGGGFLNVYGPGNPLYNIKSEVQRRSVMVSVQTTDETGTVGYEGYTLLQPHAKTNEHVIILPSSTWTFTANVSAYNKDTGACAGYIFQGCVKKDGGDPEVVGVITSQSWADTSMTGIMPKIDIDTTNQSLAVLVSGLPSNTINWGAFIDCMQVRGSGDQGL